MVIYEITGCPKILIFDPAHYNAKFQSCSTIGLWGVYPEVLRAHAQGLPFFLSCFGEKSQKLLKNHDLKIIVLKVVFETFLQNGQNKIRKKGDF